MCLIKYAFVGEKNFNTNIEILNTIRSGYKRDISIILINKQVLVRSP
jgi:hypothetical protein